MSSGDELSRVVVEKVCVEDGRLDEGYGLAGTVIMTLVWF